MSSSTETDVFLSHNWDTDDLGRDNHTRVGVVNQALKDLGYRTWFDSDKMYGSIPKRMAKGIDNTNIVIVFVTSKYRDKVNGDDPSDNCGLEFQYSLNQKTHNKVVCVVMDKQMKNTHEWKDILGMYCASKMYIDMTDDVNDKEYLSKQVHLLCKEMENLGLPKPCVDGSS